MQKILSALLLLFGMLFSINTSFAQNSEKEIGAHLLSMFENMPLNTFSNDSVSGIKIISANRKIRNYLDNICTRNPATLHMKFTSLKKYLDITTSDDGKVRTYSWNSGVNDDDYEFIQFQTGDNTTVLWNHEIKNFDDNEENTFYSKILSITTGDNKTVYLAIFNRSFPHTHGIYDGIIAWVVDNGKLKQTPFFKTAKNTLRSISYNYDCQTAQKEDSVSIHLSTDKKTLYIPVLLNGLFTRKYLVYKFDGNQFVYDKNAK